MKDTIYYKQVELLLRCLPEVGRESCFALKGGTALNLFVRDFPRLSVDIDLAYLPREQWSQAIINVESALKRISGHIKKSVKGSQIHESKNADTKRIEKLFVTLDSARIKIEPSPVIRGSVFDCQEMDLVTKASQMFEQEVSTTVLSFEDLYGGKLVAALDRQHPRDLFDTKLLLENEGLTEQIRSAFIVYLASHSRPIHEVVSPTLLDKKDEFEKEFIGMTTVSFSYKDFKDTRSELINKIGNDLTSDERQFLVSIQEGNPDWSKIKISDISELPAIKWKLQNVGQMKNNKREQAVNELKKKLKFT